MGVGPPYNSLILQEWQPEQSIALQVDGDEKQEFTMENLSGTAHPSARNVSQELAEEYVRLGGKRLAVLDDNLVSTRLWEAESAEATTFWNDRIAGLPDADRKDVEKFLPDANVT